MSENFIRPLLVGNLFQLHRPHQIWLPQEYCHYYHYSHYHVRNSAYLTKSSQNYNSFWNTCIDFVNNAFVLTFLPTCKLIWSLNRNFNNRRSIMTSLNNDIMIMRYRPARVLCASIFGAETSFSLTVALLQKLQKDRYNRNTAVAVKQVSSK